MRSGIRQMLDDWCQVFISLKRMCQFLADDFLSGIDSQEFQSRRIGIQHT